MKSKSKTSFVFIRIKLESVLIVRNKHQFTELYINNLSTRVVKISYYIQCKILSAVLYINNLTTRVLKLLKLFRLSFYAIYRSFSLFLFLIFVFTISICKRVEKEWSRSQ